MTRAQLKYLSLILTIALVLSCAKTFGDERTLAHVGANAVGTMALYYFLNTMCKAGRKPTPPNTKEMLIIAVPMMLSVGLMMEASQSMERGRPFDSGDMGANMLGVGLAAGAVFAFDL